MENDVNIKKIGVIAGILLAAAMIIFFFVMKMMNMEKIVELRMLNLPIMIIGIILAERRYKKENNGEMEYLEGFGLGIISAFVSVILFAIFMSIYLSTHPDFMEFVKEHVIMGEYLTPLRAAVGILIEGSTSGVICTFIIMQYFNVQHDSSFAG